MPDLPELRKNDLGEALYSGGLPDAAGAQGRGAGAAHRRRGYGADADGEPGARSVSSQPCQGTRGDGLVGHRAERSRRRRPESQELVKSEPPARRTLARTDLRPMRFCSARRLSGRAAVCEALRTRRRDGMKRARASRGYASLVSLLSDPVAFSFAPKSRRINAE